MNQVEICNLALSRLSEDRIEAIYPDEDSVNARLFSEAWDPARQTLLTLTPWAWAIEEAELTLEPDEEPRRWRYSYAMPAGVLMICGVADQLDTHDIAWEQQGQHILTDHPEPWLRYIVDHDTPTLWPPAFAQALSWRLAADLAIPITTDRKTQAWCEDRLNQALAMAMAEDGRRRNKAMPQHSPYLSAHVRGY